ncbi:MAG: hypothetical protein KatS3mg103_1030 [Phycisphaerales bacterium]|nr:MAG: hypothetical protein KatS3mg103_1030 [Phycisphaerales bacterium]
MLRVTGQGDRWLRVEYPRGLKALVRADQATLDPATGMVTLSQGGALKALSDTRYGVDGSFRDLQGPPTPANTKLKHLQTVTSSRGVVFYIVQAPKGAAGFIESAQARRATPGEVQAYLAALAQQDRPDQANPRPDQPEPDQPTGQPRRPPAPARPGPSKQRSPGHAQGSPPKPIGRPRNPSPTLMEPMRLDRPAQTPIQTPAQTPAPAPIERPSQAPSAGRHARLSLGPGRRPRRAGASPGPIGPNRMQARTPASPGTPWKPLPSLEALSAAFEAVRRQATLDAELDELEAAFRRVLANTPRHAGERLGGGPGSSNG